MILYEDLQLEPEISHQRLAVLEALEKAHKLHCFSCVDALAVYLDQGIAEMRPFGHTGLTRIALIYSNVKAIEVVMKRMEPGKEFAAWHQPDAWRQLYARIDELRARARSYDPQFVPRYL